MHYFHVNALMISQCFSDTQWPKQEREDPGKMKHVVQDCPYKCHRTQKRGAESSLFGAPSCASGMTTAASPALLLTCLSHSEKARFLFLSKIPGPNSILIAWQCQRAVCPPPSDRSEVNAAVLPAVNVLSAARWEGVNSGT